MLLPPPVLLLLLVLPIGLFAGVSFSFPLLKNDRKPEVRRGLEPGVAGIAEGGVDAAALASKVEAGEPTLGVAGDGAGDGAGSGAPAAAPAAEAPKGNRRGSGGAGGGGAGGGGASKADPLAAKAGLAAGSRNTRIKIMAAL